MKCPGQDMQFWDSDAIYEVKCPKCGQMVEFYKDDTTRKCNHCSHRFVNPKLDFGCATYCQFAEQCLGTLPEEFVLQQDNLLKDKVAVAVKRYFQRDFKRIRLTTRIASHAEKIGKGIDNANLALILCSAYLFFTNLEYSALQEASDWIKKKSANDAGTITEILANVGADEILVDQVRRIVTDTPADEEAELAAYAIVQDAFTITILEEELRDNTLSLERINAEIDKLSSAAAREEARQTFLLT